MLHKEAENTRHFDRNPPILSMRTKAELVRFVDGVFAQEGSAGKLGIDRKTLRNFVRKTSQHYWANPYHNFHHASDTVNTMAWMISRPRLGECVVKIVVRVGIYQRNL